mmetsp:Transcript_106783/g.300585  ORF Transcript_106783/g.300585 Transcript_106783/m.300585 type:complete len:749 (-) Transcript_106783:198-2444(-)
MRTDPPRKQRRGLRDQTLGVAREHGRLADVVQVQEEHDDALHTDATAGVRVRAIFEGIDVRLDGAQRDALGLDPLGQHLRVVDPLRARRDLLAPQEDVVGVRPARIHGVRHRVEGANVLRKLVDDVELLAVLLQHDDAEDLLVLGADVLLVLVDLHGLQMLLDQALLVIRGRRLQLPLQDRGALGAEQADSLLEGKPLARVLPLEVLEGILRLYRRDLAGEAGLEAGEDVVEEAVHHIQHLVVVLLENHLEIEAGELSHVTVGEGPLGAEDGPNLKDTRHVRHQCHLLVQLRRLSEVGAAFEVVHAENVGTTLGRTAEELGGVDLLEAVLQQILAEQRAHARLDAEDGLVRHRSQVDHAVVQAHVLAHAHQRGVLLILGLAPGGIRELQRQGRGAADAIEPLDGELDVLLRRGGDGLVRASDLREDVDHGLVGQPTREGRDLLAEGHRLHRGDVLPEREEAELVALLAAVVYSGADPDLLILHRGIQLRNIRPLAVSLRLALDEEVGEVVFHEVVQGAGGARGFGILSRDPLVLLALLLLLLLPLLLLLGLLLLLLLRVAPGVLLAVARSRCNRRSRCRRRRLRLRLRLRLRRRLRRRGLGRLRLRRSGGLGRCGLRHGDIADLVVAGPGPADGVRVRLAELVHAGLLQSVPQGASSGDIREGEPLADQESAGLELALQCGADGGQRIIRREVRVVDLQGYPLHPTVDHRLLGEAGACDRAVHQLADPPQDGRRVADDLAIRQLQHRH